MISDKIGIGRYDVLRPMFLLLWTSLTLLLSLFSSDDDDDDDDVEDFDLFVEVDVGAVEEEEDLGSTGDAF